jgi:hypothetical protein
MSLIELVMDQQTFTITFGDQAENHVGMQKLGSMASEGFNFNDLLIAKTWFEQRSVQCPLYDLRGLLAQDVIAANSVENAYVLVAHRGLNAILNPGSNADAFYQEQSVLEKDTKALMYGRVVNKNARYNLCFGEVDQEPDIANGKGRIVAFERLPLLNVVRHKLVDIIGNKAGGLVAEGNYYYDIKSCGIGFHGDGERRKVVGIRIGATLPLHYQWFHKGNPVGNRGEIILNHGDIYFMSEKAVGYDWKTRNSFTLRHAAGAPKYLTIKTK